MDNANHLDMYRTIPLFIPITNKLQNTPRVWTYNLWVMHCLTITSMDAPRRKGLWVLEVASF